MGKSAFFFAPSGEIFRREIKINHERFWNAPGTFSFVDIRCNLFERRFEIVVIRACKLPYVEVCSVRRKVLCLNNIFRRMHANEVNEQPVRNALVR